MKSIAVTVLATLLFNAPAHGRGGTDIGNGGDLVKCVPYNANDLFGLYSLDYLVFSRESGASEPPEVKSWEESIFGIRRALIDKVPELLPVFDEFVNNILNQDHSRRQVWEPTDYSLIEINDEQLPVAVKIPVNCRDNGKIQIVQAVIRQHQQFSGAPAIVYKYMPKVFDKIAAERPLQLSFLLVHEFLWSISDNVDRNRRINWFFHSREFQQMSRTDVLDRLLGMGLDVRLVPRILDAEGRGHFTTLQDALAKARRGETIIIKEGTYSTGGASIVQPIRLIGEGDRNKILIKGTVTYPALEVVLADDEAAEVENLTMERMVNFDVREYRRKEALTLVSGHLVVRNSNIRSITRATTYLTDRPTIVFDGVDFSEADYGLQIESDFKGSADILNCSFHTRTGLFIDGMMRGDARIWGNKFLGNSCPVFLDVDHTWWDGSEQNKERWRIREERIWAMFKTNQYPGLTDQKRKSCDLPP